MDVYLKLSSQTAGKDKLARLIQYAAKLLAHLTSQMHRVELADQLKHLEYHFGTFRKAVLRLGKSFEVINSTLKTLHIPDVVLRSLLSLSRIAQALYLFFDHIIWIGRAGLMKINSEKWSRLANRCWLYSITLHLLRDVYEIRRTWIDHSQRRLEQTNLSCASDALVPVGLSALAPYLRPVSHFWLERRDIVVDTAKNLFDLFIPLNNANHVHINAGIIGLLGVLSSTAGIAMLIEPSLKLSPS